MNNAEPSRNPIWHHSMSNQGYGCRANGPPCVGVVDFLFFIAVCGTQGVKAGHARNPSGSRAK